MTSAPFMGPPGGRVDDSRSFARGRGNFQSRTRSVAIIAGPPRDSAMPTRRLLAIIALTASLGSFSLPAPAGWVPGTHLEGPAERQGDSRPHRRQHPGRRLPRLLHAHLFLTLGGGARHHRNRVRMTARGTSAAICTATAGRSSSATRERCYRWYRLGDDVVLRKRGCIQGPRSARAHRGRETQRLLRE